jgi:hypothetical protein
MKVKELIAHLQQMDGELEVYVYADHGQIPAKADVPELYYTSDDTLHLLWDDWYLKEDCEGEGLIPFVLI